MSNLFSRVTESINLTDSKSATPSTEPQLAYMWEVGFRGLFSLDAEDMKFHAQSTGIPAIMNEVVKRRYAGSEYAYAGKNNSPKVFRVTFWDDQRLAAYHYFQKWAFIINDPSQGRGVRPEAYMREISLRLMDSTGRAVTEEFIFTSCFPTEITEATLSYETSATLTFDVLFNFHKRK